MKIFTIGFTKTTAEQFFNRLRQPDLVRLIDIRMNNSSQLAGFTKMKDLQYFLQVINNIDYVHLPELSPTKELLDQYKKNGGDWATYEREFLSLMTSRHIQNNVDKNVIDGGCLLCSEVSPAHCHRRLVAEYFRAKWGDVEIEHL
ncbi:MAG: DUF488 domain-containing protein [Chlorobium sp.]|nr:MAG: DUF488 domain-containing protein [Chlorobium sp.]